MQESPNSKVWDIAANTYDKIHSGAVHRYMRNIIRQTLLHYFKAGMKVLELGCGTGEESIMLAQTGVSVSAIDISPMMINIAKEKAKTAGMEGWIQYDVLPMEKVGSLQPNTFDGVFSSLGPLNCIRNLHSLGKDLAKLIKPSGIFISTVMNRFALFEFAYYMLRGKFSTAVRRWTSVIHSNDVSCWYYSPKQYYNFFKVFFKLINIQGLCVVVPPPYLEKLFEPLPFILSILKIADKLVSFSPLIRGWGDHFIMVCRRYEV